MIRKTIFIEFSFRFISVKSFLGLEVLHIPDIILLYNYGLPFLLHQLKFVCNPSSFSSRVRNSKVSSSRFSLLFVMCFSKIILVGDATPSPERGNFMPLVTDIPSYPPLATTILTNEVYVS